MVSDNLVRFSDARMIDISGWSKLLTIQEKI